MPPTPAQSAVRCDDDAGAHTLSLISNRSQRLRVASHPQRDARRDQGCHQPGQPRHPQQSARRAKGTPGRVRQGAGTLVGGGESPPLAPRPQDVLGFQNASKDFKTLVFAPALNYDQYFLQADLASSPATILPYVMQVGYTLYVTTFARPVGHVCVSNFHS